MLKWWFTEKVCGEIQIWLTGIQHTHHKWAPHLPEKQPLQKNKNTDNTINISTRIAKFQTAQFSEMSDILHALYACPHFPSRDFLPFTTKKLRFAATKFWFLIAW